MEGSTSGSEVVGVILVIVVEGGRLAVLVARLCVLAVRFAGGKEVIEGELVGRVLFGGRSVGQVGNALAELKVVLVL